MFYRKPLALLSLALASLGAHASSVDLILDVTTTSRTVGHLDPTTHLSSATLDSAYVPQSFSTTVHIDTSSPNAGLIFDPPFAITMFGEDFGSYATATPHTNELKAQGSSDPTLTAQVLQVRTIDGALGFENSELTAPPNSDALNVVAGRYSFSNGDQTSEFDYKLNMVLLTGTRDPSISTPVQPLSGAEFEAYLNALVGQTFVNAWTETGSLKVVDRVYPSPTYNSYLALDTFKYTGDITIRSVSTIPEPSSVVLSLAGLAAVSLIRNRRQAPRA
jgi:hypothetical protein